jgi:hypothetical protein
MGWFWEASEGARETEAIFELTKTGVCQEEKESR